MIQHLIVIKNPEQVEHLFRVKRITQSQLKANVFTGDFSARVRASKFIAAKT